MTVIEIRKTFTLSRGVFEALKYGLAALGALKLVPEDEDVEAERKLNNDAYSKIESSLAKYEGKYVVIARGELTAVADSLEDAYRTVMEKEVRGRHALIKRVGRKSGRARVASLPRKVEVKECWDYLGGDPRTPCIEATLTGPLGSQTIKLRVDTGTQAILRSPLSSTRS